MNILFLSVSNVNRRQCLTMMFNDLAEIQWIAYGEPWLRKYVGVCLRLHALTFRLGYWLELLYKDRLTGDGLLYLHTILTHYGIWYEVFDFWNSSTEFGEQFFARCKRILNRYTSRRAAESLIELFVRLHFEDKLNLEENKLETSSESKIGKAYVTKQFKEIVIYPSILKSGRQEDVKAFTDYLKQAGYKEYKDFYWEAECLKFNTLSDVLAAQQEQKERKQNR